MSKLSEAFLFTLVLVSKTGAYCVHKVGDSCRPFYLPKKCVALRPKHIGSEEMVFTIPRWLAESKGLVCFSPEPVDQAFPQNERDLW